jgi:hypothetical protein
MGLRRHIDHTGLLLLAAVLGLACSTVRMDFRNLPPAEALESIQPGVTTRSEVLRRLGPPEELRRPANFDRARLTTPQHRRILEEGRIYGEGAFTYAAGRRSETEFGILPIGLALLSFSWTRSEEERWRIEFDADGVVQSLSHVDEIREGR